MIPQRILIAYHSGSGSTRSLSKVIQKKIANNYQVDILKIKRNTETNKLKDYDAIIFGFPTYHCEPSKTMKEFIKRIDRFSEPKLGFCFTSYGLYHGNSLRIVIKLLQSKNIIIQDYKALKGPASDGSLLYPSKIKFMFRYGKNVRAKLDEFVNNITSSNHFRTKPKLPLWRVYVPFNELLKLVSVPIFNSYKNNLRVDYEDCITCEICVKECPRNCWIFIDDHVVFNGADCEFCTKCIHNCPTNAIIFNKKMKNKPRLNHRFYKGAIETLNKEN